MNLPLTHIWPQLSQAIHAKPFLDIEETFLVRTSETRGPPADDAGICYGSLADYLLRD